jgi:hypothetical protein
MVSNKQAKSDDPEGDVGTNGGDGFIGKGVPSGVGGAEEHEEAADGDGEASEDEE